MMVPRFKECTVWTIGKKDPVTQLPSASIPRVYKCSRKQGGSVKYVDNKGSEFYPKSTFWVRSNELIDGVHREPVCGEFIALGNHSGVSNPASVGAEPIKSVTIHDHEKFGQADSYVLATG